MAVWVSCGCVGVLWLCGYPAWLVCDLTLTFIYADFVCCFCYQYHETINEALEAVPYDGVVIVHAGVYDEQLSISKPVSIIGAGTD